MKQKILMLAVVFVLFFSCKKNSTTEPSLETITKLPSDDKELFIGSSQGNKNSNKILLFSQGGPIPGLDTNYIDSMIPDLSDYYVVYVHQAQTYKEDLMTDKYKDISFEQAILEDAVTVDIMDRVVKYFINQNKEVYIMTHSFGSFMIPQYIATKESAKLVKKYVIMAGRIDVPEFFWTSFRDGKFMKFKDDGVTIIEEGPAENSERVVATKLMAGFGRNRYSEMLKDNDLSNVIYVHAGKDTNTGRLLKNEVDFLTSKNAKVLFKETGDHNSMFDDDAFEAEIIAEFLK